VTCGFIPAQKEALLGRHAWEHSDLSAICILNIICNLVAVSKLIVICKRAVAMWLEMVLDVSIVHLSFKPNCVGLLLLIIYWPMITFLELS